MEEGRNRLLVVDTEEGVHGKLGSGSERNRADFLLAAIQHGERIAQAVIAPVIRAAYVIAETLDDTARGAGGFGSTGRG